MKVFYFLHISVLELHLIFITGKEKMYILLKISKLKDSVKFIHNKNLGTYIWPEMFLIAFLLYKVIRQFEPFVKCKIYVKCEIPYIFSAELQKSNNIHHNFTRKYII